MAYSPVLNFNINGGSYTPVTTYSFTNNTQGSFDVTLDNLTGSFTGELDLTATFSPTLADVTGSFSAQVNPPLQGTITATLENLTGSLSGQQPIEQVVSTYTPSTSFSFSGGDYSPSTSFVFTTADHIGDLSGILDGLTGSISATYDDEQIANKAGTLEGITGSFDGIVRNYPTGWLNAQIEGLSGSFSAEIPNIGIVTGQIGDLTANFYSGIDEPTAILNKTLDGLVGTIIAEYDPNVTRWVVGTTISVKQDAQKNPPEIICNPVDQSTYFPAESNSIQSDTSSLFNKSCFPFDQASKLPNALCSFQTDTLKVQPVKTEFVEEQGTPIDHVLEFLTDDATFIDDKLCSIKQQMTKVYPDKWELDIQDSGGTEKEILKKVYYHNGYNPTNPFDFTASHVPDTNFNFPDGEIGYLRQGQYAGIVPIQFFGDYQEATFHDEKRCSVVEETKQPEIGVTPWVDLPRDPVDPEPPSGDTYIVPTEEVYTMQNILLSTLFDDTTVIDLNNVNLSLDADSHSWQFSADLLDPSQRALVKPAPDGTPVEIHVTINSYTWYLIVEKITTTRKFEGEKIRISGRSLSAWLSKPYEQAVSVNQGSLLTVQQIADSLLPIGWTNDWQTVTWNVDAGAYSHVNKTPIEALKQIADDIGAVLVPNRISKTMKFLPRYPVLPWNFDGVAVDVQIPDSAIIELTEEPTSSFQANGVYIHGNEIGGELAFIRLNGTAGDRLADTTNNHLMTDVIGLRALGERILAGQYEQPKIKSITTFMDGTTVPLIEIGDFIGFDVDGVVTKGVINGVSLTATHSQVYQTVSIGEETPNKWVAFKEILPKDPMLVGSISSTDGTTSLVTLIDGGVVRVRGTGTVSNNYYIRSGEIVMEAPNLTSSTIVL